MLGGISQLSLGLFNRKQRIVGSRRRNVLALGEDCLDQFSVGHPHESVVVGNQVGVVAG